MSGRHASAAPVASGDARSGDAADAEIGAALARGDTRTALRSCIEQYAANIGRLCMTMLGSQRAADDATQRTLLTAHQSFGDFHGESSLRAWLCGIARHECLRHREQSRGRPARPMSDAHGRQDAEGRRRHTRGLEARALIERLRPSERDALLLRFSADLSFEEVAAATGVDEPTARKRVARALLRLRHVLEDEQ